MRRLVVGFMSFAVLPVLLQPVFAEKGVMDKKAAPVGPGLYAHFNTSLGSFTVKLLPEVAPKTVENFAGLASGTKPFKDPKTGQTVTRPFYDGLIFHRVIANFMIQGGDPLGTGTGGPGYQFADEFDKHPGFNKPGYLAMANAGPNTNGSQFFITVVPTPHLNPRPDPYGTPRGHTIFGEVVQGYDVVDKISKVAVDGNDRPLKPVILNSVKIEDTRKK